MGHADTRARDRRDHAPVAHTIGSGVEFEVGSRINHVTVENIGGLRQI